MRLSHTFLLVSMLSFGGFMVSKLAYGLVTPTQEVREVPQRVLSDRPLKPVASPKTLVHMESCPLHSSQSPDGNQTLSENSTKKPSGLKKTKRADERTKAPTCCSQLNRHRLHLI